MELKFNGGEYAQAQAYVQPLPKGKYSGRDYLHGILFFCADPKEYADQAVHLELDDFPLPESLQVKGLSKCLSSFGIERSRLMSMYR